MGKPNLSTGPQAFGSVIRIQNSKLRIKNALIVRNTNGFTLIELLVAITMLSVMISLVILFIDPVKQLQKAKDAQREQDFKQMINALDTYYNDNNAYPASISFGKAWLPYMQKVPQNPECASTGSCYGYVTDGSTTSQWNILFTKIYNLTNVTVACSLADSCKPTNFTSQGYNYCTISGTFNFSVSECDYINTHAALLN